MLLGLGVEHVLTQSSRLEVMNSYPKDLSEILSLVEHYRPDVVVLGGCFEISQESVFFQLLVDKPQLQIIAVHLDNNWLRVYQRRSVLVSPASDLVQIIAGT